MVVREPMFREVASWFSDSQEFEFEVIAAGASGDLAYKVGYERNQVRMEGKPGVYTLRVTHVYRREDVRWRIVHRHANLPPAGDTDVRPRYGLASRCTPETEHIPIEGRDESLEAAAAGKRLA